MHKVLQRLSSSQEHDDTPRRIESVYHCVAHAPTLRIEGQRLEISCHW